MKKVMKIYFLGAVTRKASTIELNNCRATRKKKGTDDIILLLVSLQGKYGATRESL